MEQEILIIEGENHTIKSLTELAEQQNRKVLIVGAGEDITPHTETIKKFSRGSVGVVMVCMSQLAFTDRSKLEAPRKKDPFAGGMNEIIENIIADSRRIVLDMLPEPILVHDCNQRREVKHRQAKPVRQYFSPKKNHQFQRK